MERAKFRPEIEGLRGIAVLMVVAFHAGFGWARNGFFGVDVFFVISGYLITTLLDSELQAKGGVSLWDFWARRIRRLVPLATLVTLATAVASWLFLPFTRWSDIATSTLAAGFYVSNIRFMQGAGNYFAGPLETDPYLHYWSLAVEEQFYLLWPLLAVASGVAGRLGARNPRRSLAILAGLASAVSLIWAFRAGSSAPAAQARAFFFTPVRIWELGFGGLLALVVANRGSLFAKSWPTWLGLFGIGVALVMPDVSSGFPAIQLMVPVLATLLILGSRTPIDSPIGRALTNQPLRLVGRISYGWYLWHWPFLVIGEWVLDSDSLATKLVLIALSFATALASHHLVEEPARRGVGLGLKPTPAFVFAALTLVLAVASFAALNNRQDAATTEALNSTLLDAQSDLGGLSHTYCDTTDASVLIERCRFGGGDAVRVLLLGDSHAAHWQEAVTQASSDLGGHMILSFKPLCPAFTVRVQNFVGGVGEPYPACDERQGQMKRLLSELQPDIVVVAGAAANVVRVIDADGEPLERSAVDAVWTAAVAEFAAMVEGEGTDLVWFLDTARFATSPIDCLASRAADDCAEPRSEVLALADRTAELELAGLADHPSVGVFDPRGIVCPETVCDVMQRDQVMYGDTNHLTGRYSLTFVPLMVEEFELAAAAG